MQVPVSTSEASDVGGGDAKSFDTLKFNVTSTSVA